ncbi:HNH endonuclease signature motif containing protein [Cytobacillus massiliigabonensis]|uniref:HNH endonuclease signature motif containing protein n=1 Tax=Cytobacillus massiliigabonensis TaxID=1871011 RepID=UPI000C85ED36|nr:HNH endonuclease signature motif containing protein [Cytobacillus massiliigabonensis]
MYKEIDIDLMFKHIGFEYENNHMQFDFLDNENLDLYDEELRDLAESYLDAESNWDQDEEEELRGHYGAKKEEPFFDDYKGSSLETMETIEVENQNPKLRQYQGFDRNRDVSIQLKERYQHTCQICNGNRLETAPDEFYTETHHLHSIGELGPDIPENMVVTCQDCHKLLDKGSMYIEPETYRIQHFDTLSVYHGMKIKLKHDIGADSLLFQKRKFIGFKDL